MLLKCRRKRFVERQEKKMYSACVSRLYFLFDTLRHVCAYFKNASYFSAYFSTLDTFSLALTNYIELRKAELFLHFLQNVIEVILKIINH